LSDPQSDFSDEIEFKIPEGGLAVWSNFDKKIDLIKMSEDALKKGLYIGNGIFIRTNPFQPMRSEWALLHLMKKRWWKRSGS
jgi:DNA-binding transcriptional MocR family regulator